MISPGGATSDANVGALVRMIAAFLCALAIAVPVAQLVGASPAGAATRGVTPVASRSAAKAPASGPLVPHCPPDCGRVAAGDPLLVPYLTPNPGPGWSALPAAEVQPFVNTLKRNLGGNKGVLFNAVAGRWEWVTKEYQLLVVLVSSPSLADVHLQTLDENAQDLCDSAHGVPNGRLAKIADVPDSVFGTCAIKAGTSTRGATVASFNHGDVAVLIEITSTLPTPIDPRNTALVAQQQYLSLPAGNVLVSRGFDTALLVFWLFLVAVLIACMVACARRRESWRGPFDAVAEAFGYRKVALGVTVVAVIGGMAFAMLDSSLLHGFGQWYDSSFDDLWRSWSSAGNMTFGGGYGHVFNLDSALEAAPAVQIVVAPIARLAFGLSFPYPSDVLYPTAFWVAGPLFLSAMALPICGGDRWLEYMGVTDIRRRLAVLAVLAVTLPAIALDGHPEDLIALGAMLYGLIAALQGRSRAVGWWFGVALAFQFLAFLGVPLALVLLKKKNIERRQWFEAVVPMVVLPLLVLAVPLATEASATVRQLIHQKVYDISGFITPTWHLDPGVAAFIRVLVALAAVPAALLIARFLQRNDRDLANLVVWTLGLLFGLRVFEPELVPYFLCPALALLAISAARAPWWRFIGTCILAVWVNWWLKIPIAARWLEWLVLLAQLAVLLWLGRPAAPEASSVEEKKEAVAPKRAPAPVGPTAKVKARPKPA